MANYSTIMGILQPQVGKSGDILLKFELKNGSPGGNRTHDQLLRRQLLYPLSYRAMLLYNIVLVLRFVKFFSEK